MQPVSVVLTELNEAAEIARAVESLLAQEPSAAEVVVVDGGSTDGTWEWLAAKAAVEPRLKAIRDETCSLKYCDGPVSKGRNVAIEAASSWLIATADAGCTYAPDWLRNLTAPLQEGTAEYTLGGSVLDRGGLDAAGATPWDVASAPYFSVKLDPEEPTKSCTARSMAFTRALWERVGRFPEDVLVGEDTLFDFEARRQGKVAFVANAKAIYRPMNTYRTACRQMARYAMSDGMARVRGARLTRNAARCLLELAALVSFQWTIAPLLVVMAIEGWYAFGKDWKHLRRFGSRSILARLAFSASVPWIVAYNQTRGLVRQERQTNWQNDRG
jgi:glycosyltransferase involved in cell wall biosynthesis